MRNSRHIGRAGGDYDKKFEFTSPDARGSMHRTAFHRYLPAEMKAEASREMGMRARSEDEFSAEDFRPRWWPAPDVSE